MKLVGYLLRASRWTAILSIVTGALCGISTAGLVALINTVLQAEAQAAQAYLPLFVGLLLALIGLTIWSQVVLVRLAATSVYELRVQISRQILATPLRQLEELGPHRLLAVLTDDIADISNGYLNLPTLFIQGTALLAGLLYLAVLSWIVFAAAIGFLLLGAISYLAMTRRALGALTQAREAQDGLFKHLRGLTEGSKELKIHAPRREAFLNQELMRSAQATRDHTITGMQIYALARGWGNSLFFVLLGLLLFGLPLIQPIDSFALRGAALVVLYMISPLAIILNLLPTFGRAAVALQKVDQLKLSLTSSASEAVPATLTGLASWQELRLEGVTHAYYHEADDTHFALGPLDLSFRPGELVFLVGGNGSGKTTLAKLLIGLYPPESGKILLDGQPITEQNREAYRQLFAVVFADFYLFEQLLGLVAPELDSQAREYLSRLHLERKVQVSDGMLSTTALSQGQRKRLALLTAYLENRPFYVFDEWAADQDPVFKQLFYTQLLPDLKARGKTVLVITHDDRYFDRADRLIKLESGKLVDPGQRMLQSVAVNAVSSPIGQP